MAHHDIVLTFIRHAESMANLDHIIDTTVPGPSLDATGWRQADDESRDPVNYDGIWASTMIRTQQTAAPLADARHQPVHILDGLKEIGAGDDEGKPTTAVTTAPVPAAWVHGDLVKRIPGGENGDEFNARVCGAIRTIYASGQRHPVVFSHGWTIAYWTLMHTHADASLADDLLPNTARVVIRGNPYSGWKLLSWDGKVKAPAGGGNR